MKESFLVTDKLWSDKHSQGVRRKLTDYTTVQTGLRKQPRRSSTLPCKGFGCLTPKHGNLQPVPRYDPLHEVIPSNP
ncbi:hypothetical protein J6590_086620 [Homalodisca vitripennis]|nr:hypothetical protein J6590_086620 [Homalodisca vitripennis]